VHVRASLKTCFALDPKRHDRAILANGIEGRAGIAREGEEPADPERVVGAKNRLRPDLYPSF